MSVFLDIISMMPDMLNFKKRMMNMHGLGGRKFMPNVSIHQNQLSLSYELDGPEQAPTLILLHGFCRQ